VEEQEEVVEAVIDVREAKRHCMGKKADAGAEEKFDGV